MNKQQLTDHEEVFFITDFDSFIQVQINSIFGPFSQNESSLREYIETPYSSRLMNCVGEVNIEVAITTSDNSPLHTKKRIYYKPVNRIFNETVDFPIKYRDLPLDATLVVTVYDAFFPLHSKVIGGTSLRLFDRIRLQTGEKTLRVWDNKKGHPKYTPGELELVQEESMDDMTRVLKNNLESDKEVVVWLEKLFWERKRVEGLIQHQEEQRVITLNLTLPQSRVPILYYLPPVQSDKYFSEKSSSIMTSSTHGENLSSFHDEETSGVSSGPAISHHSSSSSSSSSDRKRKGSLGKRSKVMAEDVENFLHIYNQNTEDFFEESVFTKNPVHLKFLKLGQHTLEQARQSIPDIKDRQKLGMIVKRTSLERISHEEKNLVWTYRYWLMNTRPEALVKVIFSATVPVSGYADDFSRSPNNEINNNNNDNNINNLITDESNGGFGHTSNERELRRKLNDFTFPREKKKELQLYILRDWNCSELGFNDSLELLSYRYEEEAFIRKFAVEKLLMKLPDSDIFGILLQLVQGLHYETEMDLKVTTLGNFLLKRAGDNFEIAVFLYWHMNVEIENAEGREEKRKFEVYQKSLLEAMSPQGRDWMNRQIRFFEYLKNYLESLMGQKLDRSVMNKRVRKDLDALPTDIRSEFPFPFHLDPNIIVEGVVAKDCFFFNSNTRPLCLMLKTKDHGNVRTIFKIGDDLRQDQLIIQTIRLMNEMLLNNTLDLKMTSYRILPCELNSGFVEFVNGVTALQKITEKLAQPILPYLAQKQGWDMKTLDRNPHYRKMVELFRRSNSAYCVVSYVLGFGDRHLDNILVLPNGKMFHIDFGFILGRQPRGKGLIAPQIKLTRPMVDAIGGMDSPSFARFLEEAMAAYTIFRRNARLFVNLYVLMIDSKIEDIVFQKDRFTERRFDRIKQLHKNLRVRLRSRKKAEMFVAQQIMQNYSTWGGIIENWTHTFAQNRKK